MNIDAFLGNDAPKAQLAEQLRQDTLAHALLICAQDGCGAGYFARLLAADLLEADAAAEDGPARARRVLQGADPDCLEISGEGASGLIRVDAIRDARSEARATSLSGTRRVVIVYNASALAAAPANALLKILEEPPAGVWFLITAPSTAVVLPTVRSRCALITLSPLPEALCAEELCRRGVPRDTAAHLAGVWQGRLGAALGCIEGESAALFAAAETLTAAVLQRDAYAMMKLLVPYEKQRDAAITLLHYAAQLLHSALREGRPGVLPADIRALLDTATLLSQNVNPRLALTALCGQLGQ